MSDQPDTLPALPDMGNVLQGPKPDFAAVCGIVIDHVARNDGRIARQVLHELAEIHGLNEIGRRDLLLLECGLNGRWEGDEFVLPAELAEAVRHG